MAVAIKNNESLVKSAPEFLPVQEWLNSFSNLNTRRAYKDRIQDLFDFQNKFADDREISTDLIQSYCQNVHERIDEGVISRSTARAYLYALSGFLKWCCIFDVFPNLTEAKIDALLEIPDGKGIDPKAILTPQEMRNLIQSADKTRNKTLMVLLADTGLRVSEVVEIIPANFVKRTDETERYLLEILNAKNNKDRTVPLSEPAYKAVKQYLNEQGRDIASKDEQPVFESQKGGGISKRTVNRIIKKVARQAELGRKISVHDVRKTAATRWIERDIPLRIVAKWLGNSIEVCEENYVWLLDHLNYENKEAWWSEDTNDLEQKRS